MGTPQVIQDFIDAVNSEDREKYLSIFTEDAYINDWGREFHGLEGAASWNESDNMGVHSRFDVHKTSQGTTPDEYIVSLTVSGGGYNGDGDVAFGLTADHSKIKTLNV